MLRKVTRLEKRRVEKRVRGKVFPLTIPLPPLGSPRENKRVAPPALRRNANVGNGSLSWTVSTSSQCHDRRICNRALSGRRRSRWYADAGVRTLGAAPRRKAHLVLEWSLYAPRAGEPWLCRAQSYQ